MDDPAPNNYSLILNRFKLTEYADSCMNLRGGRTICYDINYVHIFFNFVVEDINFITEKIVKK